jgi:hypothetical protein
MNLNKNMEDKGILTIKEMYDKLGIKNMIDKSESAEDPNVRFSKFDKCRTYGMEFLNGEVKVSKEYNRIRSQFFEKVFSFLQGWGYEIDQDHYDSKRHFLDSSYKFKGKDLPEIKVNLNFFHDDIFKTSIGYERESDWLQVEKLEQEINKQIVSYFKRSGDIKLLRELKLRQLLNEV